MRRLVPAVVTPLAAMALAVASLSGVRPTETQAADRARARIEAGVAKLYDRTVLHRIDIVIASEHVDQIRRRTADRVPSTFTIDGVTLRNVGVRQAGGIYHAYVNIAGKPSLSVKFDEFTKGQVLYGLDKLILKNELQDYSLVNEHLTYEVFRRAGLAAPMTAHARVTINGIDSGIYLMREPIDKAFLVRNFGGGMDTGNLYEIENIQDFVRDPRSAKLDDEGKNGRTRSDIVAFAKAIGTSTPSTFVAAITPHVDLDRLVAFVAAEIATSHWDGFSYRSNNTYMYAHPKDGRFVFLPYGADQAFGGDRGFGANGPLRSALVQGMMRVPALEQKVDAEVARITRPPVWNQQVLLDRIDRVGRILATAESSGRTRADVGKFAGSRAFVEGMVRSGGR